MKTKVAIVFGGKSAEFEVSLNSASNIHNAIDKSKYQVVLLGINKNGNWFHNKNYRKEIIDLTNDDFFNNAQEVYIERIGNQLCIVEAQTNISIGTFEVAFSIIHGTFGEDGTLQGFFKSLNIPFVGPDVLGSAVCMDKEITKRLLRDNNIPIANFVTVRKNESTHISYETIKGKLGLPLFIKPCNAGSSVGVNKVTDRETYDFAINKAFEFDNKILIEEAIVGKEVECAILGNEKPKASIIGEIIPTKEFYSYEAKYVDSNGAKLKIPAEINVETEQELRETAIKAFKITSCEGMARVDFFLKPDNSFILNEINTLPGFTKISMYPKLWERTGIHYTDLISKLIDLAFERKIRDNKLKI